MANTEICFFFFCIIEEKRKQVHGYLETAHPWAQHNTATKKPPSRRLKKSQTISNQTSKANSRSTPLCDWKSSGFALSKCAKSPHVISQLKKQLAIPSLALCTTIKSTMVPTSTKTLMDVGTCRTNPAAKQRDQMNMYLEGITLRWLTFHQDIISDSFRRWILLSIAFNSFCLRAHSSWCWWSL